MPELPDLVYIEKKLRPVVLDREIREAPVWEPIVLRVGVPGSFSQVLPGRIVRGLGRHGPFLLFTLPPLQMVVHFMLAGFFRVQARRGVKEAAGRRLGRDHCFSLVFQDGGALHYFDSRRMGRIYIVEGGDTAAIPGFDSQGVDLFSPAFTAQAFEQAIRGRRQQARVFLMDQSRLSALGNAYSDEILFAAGIHPKTRCDQLDRAQIDRLYRSVCAVLREAVDEVEKADRGVDVKMRDHLKVRNRKGQPCPACGTTIRRTGVLGYDSFFCPKCQPEPRGLPVSWKKLP